MAAFSDDDPIFSTQEHSSGPKRRSLIADRTKLRVINKNIAPLEATNLTVLLELMGNGSKEDVPGVDIVTVLDVSGSMGADNKLQQLKATMQFFIKKLSPAHRLSVITFSRHSQRLCPLRQMTEIAQQETEELVNNLRCGGTTNIADGLRTALGVLDGRKFSHGRVAAIMLMSDGDQSTMFEDARRVPVGEVPIFTFGFGRGHEYNPEVLNAVARNSKGGTFSVAEVEDTESNNLSIAFAQCLAGLLTVVVQDLQLTVTNAKSDVIITNVSAGDYPQSRDASASTVISFGDLYYAEVRKVLVDLALPADENEEGSKVLDITYSYTYDGEQFDSLPMSVSVVRIGAAVDEEREEVTNEQKRVETTRTMQRAIILGDNRRLDEAQYELKQALDSLDNMVKLNLNRFDMMLKSELQQLLKLMQSPEIYTSKGRHFAQATLTSHDRQREALRGYYDPANPSFFATPAMKAMVNEAIHFMMDPIMQVLPDINIHEAPTEPTPPPPQQPPSSVGSIVVSKLSSSSQSVPNSLGHIAGPLSQHLGTTIMSLKAIRGNIQAIEESLQAIQDLLLNAGK